MAMVKMARTAGIAAVLLLVAAVPARANFFPTLTLGIDPPTASSASSLTATVNQAAADTPIERFTLNLPSGFQPIGAPAAAPGAQIGTVSGSVGGQVSFGGVIRKVAADRFAVVLNTLGGSLVQVIPGTLTRRADGSLDLKVDQLPALDITSLSFRFDGGGSALVRTPKRCGSYAIDGKFTSRRGEFALDRRTVAITGCHGVPAVRVANLRMSHRRFRAGGSRLGYRTIIAWWASRAVDHTDVRIERKRHGRWRVLGVLVSNAYAGENHIRWDGRLRDRVLKPGRYGVRIQPAGSAPSRVLRFRVRGR